jgi:hypothetical protein
METDDLNAAQARIGELEAALRFYADPETYSEFITLDIMPIGDDLGRQARQALGLPEPDWNSSDALAETALEDE